MVLQHVEGLGVLLEDSGALNSISAENCMM
jgi:hypothetical protein